MRNTCLCLAGAAALAASAFTPALAQQPGAAATKHFITTASQSDEFEITEGRLAERMGASEAVRHMGAKMVHDHTMTTQNLHRAIEKAGMAVPPPPPLRPDQKEMVAQLKAAGPAFDRDYVRQQIEAHRQALAAVERYAHDGDVLPIRTAAEKTAPIVAQHLRMFEHLSQGHAAAM